MNNTDTKKETNPGDDEFEANQNWVGFWNLLIHEDIKQNPDLYKKFKNTKNIKQIGLFESFRQDKNRREEKKEPREND